MSPHTPPLLSKLPVAGLPARRGLRLFAGLVAALALLLVLAWGVVRVWGAGWLAAPLARSLGRAVTIEAVDWRPWSLRVRVQGLQIAGAQPGPPLWRSERIDVALSASSLWRGRPVLRALHVQAPHLTLRRTGQGRYDVDDLLARALQPSAGPPLAWSVHNIGLEDGRIDFHDEPLGQTHRVRALRLAWPFVSSAPADVAVLTQPHLSFELNGEPVDLQARSTPFAPDHRTHLQLEVPHLDLQTYRPYWPASIPWQPLSGVAQLRMAVDFDDSPAPRLRLQGDLSLRDARWQSRQGPEAQLGWGLLQLRLEDTEPLAGLWTVPQLRLEGLHGGPASQTPPALALQALTVQGLQIDTARRMARLQALELQAPDLHLDRDAHGQWTWDRLGPAGSPAPAAPTEPADPAVPWAWSLDRLRVHDGRLALRDQATPRPVAWQWSQWQLQLDGLDSGASADMPLQTSWRWDSSGARAGARTGEQAGQVQYQGRLRLTQGGPPLSLQGQLQLQHLPLHALEAYAAPWLQARLLRAWLQYKGRLDLGWSDPGPSAHLSGQLALDGLRLRMPGEAQDVLRWQALQLRGLDVQVHQGQLQRVSVAETALSDYAVQARLDAAGRLNLLDLVHAPASEPAAAAPAAPQAPAASAALASPTVPVRLGPISLVQGRVQFRDDFVQPAYSVDLSQVTGGIGAFSNQPGAGGALAPADVLLRGRAEGRAELEIRGQIQPLAQPVVLDLKGRLHGLDLAPLTGYSSRLTGYGIERGKLSLDASYQVDDKGQLQASNRIVLDQLVFGERLDREGVPNWPVKFAVSLLADRNGVVDIQLPVRGSLNDPEFSVGGIVLRLLFNLVAKAVTSPLSLLAAAFGQGEEMTQVLFEPGQASLSGASQAALDKLAGWMRQREGWMLTVQGEADAAVEQAAYRRARLQQMVQAQKDRRSSPAGQPPGEAVGAQEWPQLLRQVYQSAKISKPRNAIGMVRDLPVQDMESLLLASIAVDESAMQALAQARARSVRDALLSRDIAAEQIFLATPRLGAGTTDWTPRARLQLQAR